MIVITSISNEGEIKKCYVKYVFWIFFKNYKTVNESISRNSKAGTVGVL